MGISVDEEARLLNALLMPGQKLRIRYEENASSEHIVPVKLPLQIIYEDEDLLVLNKPADMPIHPSQGNYENTLANALAYYYRDENFTFRCINRLDRDTTGLLLVAKHGISACILSDAMKNRQIKRVYYAIAEGRTPPMGRIDAPIARAEGSTIERRVDFAHGERAVTHFRTHRYEDGYSLVELCLENGRTHQIRVHMRYAGYPLPGDFLYHPDYRKIGRQALHAAKLSFRHPLGGQMLSFSAEFPEDFRRFFAWQNWKNML